MTRTHAGALALTLALGACAGDDAHQEGDFAELADVNNVGALTGESSPPGAGDISVNGACGNTSCASTLFGSASITATALPGYHFTGWTGCAAADDLNAAAQPTLSYFIVFPEQHCTAHFEADAPTTPPPPPPASRVRLTLNLPPNVHITDTNADQTAVCNDAYCDLAADSGAGIFIETPWQGAGATPLILGSTCTDDELHVSFIALVGNNVRYGMFTGLSADRTCLLDLRPGGVFTAAGPTDAHTTPTLSTTDTVATYLDNTNPNYGTLIAVVPPNRSVGLLSSATHGWWSCSDGQYIPATQYYWSAPIQAGQLASCTYIP